MTQFNPVFGEWLMDYGYIIGIAVGVIVVSVYVLSKVRDREVGEPKGKK